MNPFQRLSSRLIIAIEAMALAALLFSGEVDFRIAIPPVLLAFTCFVSLRWRLADRWIFTLLAALIFSSIGIYLYRPLPPIIIAAHGVFYLHSILWLARNRSEFSFWRMGLSFVEILITASLTPELHLFFLISVYVLVSSLAVSLRFLEGAFAMHAPKLLRNPVEKSYLRAYFSFSLVIFLSSLLLFPLIPRARWSMLPGFGQPLVGYKDEVKMDWRDGLDGSTQKVVMRVFLADAEQEKDPRLKLLRGRTLDRLEGDRWLPGWNRVLETAPAQVTQGNTFRVIREPMESNVVLLPYNAVVVNPVQENIRRTGAGDWLGRGGYNRRLTYDFFFPEKFSTLNTVDKPKRTNSLVPEMSPAVVGLANELFKNRRTTKAKVAAMLAYYSVGFSASLEAPVSKDTADPVENFLLKEKTGRCEAFAGSAAVLLRIAGVPTRLVTGFRPAREATNKMLTVRAGDAHVWLEAWDATGGWFPIDPTPVTYLEDSLWTEVQDVFEDLSGLWYRYVLDYNADDIREAWKPWNVDAETFSFNLKTLAIQDNVSVFAGFALLFPLGAAFFFFRRRKKMRNIWYQELLDERLDLERRLGLNLREHERQQRRWGSETSEQVKKWARQYEALRFGQAQIVPEEVRELRDARKAILRTLGKSRASISRDA